MEVVAQKARGFVKNTPYINKRGTGFDKEFLISALTSHVSGTKVHPTDIEAQNNQ